MSYYRSKNDQLLHKEAVKRYNEICWIYRAVSFVLCFAVGVVFVLLFLLLSLRLDFFNKWITDITPVIPELLLNAFVWAVWGSVFSVIVYFLSKWRK